MKSYFLFNKTMEMPFVLNGKEYKKENCEKLHRYLFPIHKYYNTKNEIITHARFICSKEKEIIMEMWLGTEDLKYFEKEIIMGALVPIDFRLTTDSVDDLDIKTTFVDKKND